MKIQQINNREEIKSIIELFKDEFSTLPGRVSLDAYSEKLSRWAHVAKLCETDEPVGIAAVYMNDYMQRTAYISLIGILEEYQDRGYGRKLMEYCIKKSIKAGMTTIALEVDLTNYKAINFYLKNGFAEELKTDRNSAIMHRTICEFGGGQSSI